MHSVKYFGSILFITKIRDKNGNIKSKRMEPKCKKIFIQIPTVFKT